MCKQWCFSSDIFPYFHFVFVWSRRSTCTFWPLSLCFTSGICLIDFIRLGAGYQTWHSWPPSSHTVAWLLTMSATWITKATREWHWWSRLKYGEKVSPGYWTHKRHRQQKNGRHIHTPQAYTHVIGQIHNRTMKSPAKSISTLTAPHYTPWFPSPTPATTPPLCV